MSKSTSHACRVLGVIALLMGPASRAVVSQGYDQPLNVQLSGIEDKLRRGEWAPARHAAQALTGILAERGGGTTGDFRINEAELGGAMASADPPAHSVLLARAAASQAIAEAALNLREEARWHWYLAQNLSRDLRSIDLSPYGAAGVFLREHVLADADAQHADMIDVFDPVKPEGRNRTSFHEPVRTKAVYPQRPRDLRSRERFSHVVFVQVTIDQTGRVVQPLVVDAGFYPGLIYRAFEALREWRYEPARLDGKPISYRFVIPVVFTDDGPRPAGVAY